MNDSRDVPSFIGVDWGSSRLRAYAISSSGTVLDTAFEKKGILYDRCGDDLEQVLLDLVAPWQHRWPGLPMVASGMIGSRTGLVEIPYVHTPAVADGLRKVMGWVPLGESYQLTIVPGLLHQGRYGVDVMRGEETLVLGWLAQDRGDTNSVLLPGTHSKWARVAHGRIEEFCTFSTGELFETLLNSGSLKDLNDGADRNDAEAFIAGAEYGLESNGLLHDYFLVRARTVTGEIEPGSVASFLSGILIGYEISEASHREVISFTEPIVIVSEGILAHRYSQALELAGFKSIVVSSVQCLVAGWMELGRRCDVSAEAGEQQR